MPARRRWAPVVEASTNDRAGALGANVRHKPRSGCHNDSYTSLRAGLDQNAPSARFVSPACIDGWRESLRTDAELRAALLNPVDYEP